MAGFKFAVTKPTNELRQMSDTKLWQRNYWEHIIRNESELNRIREYIHDHPTQWEKDKLHPLPGGGVNRYHAPMIFNNAGGCGHAKAAAEEFGRKEGSKMRSQVSSAMPLPLS